MSNIGVKIMTLRLNTNTNLKLFTNNKYRGLRVYTSKGALVESYLAGCVATISQALSSHQRTLAIRVDLRFPDNAVKTDDAAISRFIASLKAQVKADYRRKSKTIERVHSSDVRFIWTREKDESVHHHYHVLLLFNADSFYHLGDFKASEGNMAARIKKAWASAIGVSLAELGGGAFFPSNPIYRVNTKGKDYVEVYHNLFFRVSYFTKAVTKQYGQKVKHFGRSRT